MGDPSQYSFSGSVKGAAAEVTISTCPFRPRSIEFWVVVSTAIEHGYKTEEMLTDTYLSTTTGLDAGVTITDTGCVIANGADVNSAGATIYFRMEG